jgi:glutamine amidotransferase/cyclase
MSVSLLDYGAGNVLSVINAVKKLGYQVNLIKNPGDIQNAKALIFPGVGSFGSCMEALEKKQFFAPLKEYVQANKPFFGICLGMQTLFEGSEETPGVQGLGVIPTIVQKFDTTSVSVPHMGWNGMNVRKSSPYITEQICQRTNKVYFVHSYRAVVDTKNMDWVLTTTNYGPYEFVSSVQKGNVFGTQFHPEKSGQVGLSILKRFLDQNCSTNPTSTYIDHPVAIPTRVTALARRVVACLDVRTTDEGVPVVTKGDQYNVRDGDNKVRNLGDPAEMAQQYYLDGADEVTFLNITGYRNCPLKDRPIIDVLKKTSENVFVPLTIGGGIREYTDEHGQSFSALDVASEYFRSGADKVSIGSDAVLVVEEYLANNKIKTGKSSIEQISHVYGVQAVVISVDARRQWVKSPSDTTHHTIKHSSAKGPNGEEYCWYQCTVKGGREGRDLDVKQLVMGCESLGAGEVLLNCIDRDGTNSGYEVDMIRDVKSYVTIPVVASSGAGKVEHFTELFAQVADVEAALAAGIFHRKEVTIQQVKEHLQNNKIVVRTEQ